MENKKVKVSGSLVTIRFQKDGFIIGNFCDYTKSPVFNFTAKGNIINPQIQMEYILIGEWFETQQWGKQFQIDSFETVQPSDVNGILKYLVRICKFVGPVVGRSLVDTFGEDTLERMKNNPKHVSDGISGITFERALEIQKVLKENEETEKLMVELEGLLSVPGMFKNVAPRLIELYKSNAAEILKQNPYILTTLNRIGFSLADRVAMKNDFPRDGVERKKAACLHVIKEIMGDGNIWVPTRRLIDGMRDLIQVRNLQEGIDDLVKHSIVVRQPGTSNIGLYALAGPAEDENFIANKIVEMLVNK